MGQDKYLKEIKLKFSQFNGSIREHDHCEFCFAKFSNNENDLHQGYCSLDKYHWICEMCYNDFKDYFQWKVVK